MVNLPPTQILSYEEGGSGGTLKLRKGQNVSEREFDHLFKRNRYTEGGFLKLETKLP